MKQIFGILLTICFCISLTACGDPTPQEINDETVKMVLICEGDAHEEDGMDWWMQGVTVLQ